MFFCKSKTARLISLPREMYHPLFGAMPRTALMAELQITQEYLGHETDLVYLAALWTEFLESDTCRNGPGSTVAKILGASPMTGIAGVANTGSDTNCVAAISRRPTGMRLAGWPGTVI